MEAFQGPRWRENASRPPGPVHGFIRRPYPQMRQNCPPFERNWGRNNDRRELWNGNNDGGNYPMGGPHPQGPRPPSALHGSPPGGPHSGMGHQHLQQPSPEKNGSPENQWSPSMAGGGSHVSGGPHPGPSAGGFTPGGFHHPPHHMAGHHHMNRRGRNAKIRPPLLNGQHSAQLSPSHLPLPVGPHHGPPCGPLHPSPGATSPYSSPLYHNHPPHPSMREGDSPHQQHHPLMPHTPHPSHHPPHQAHTMCGGNKLTDSPSALQDTRSIESPLSSFASPSSNEGDTSSSLLPRDPRDPRDPRFRSQANSVTAGLPDRQMSSSSEYHQSFNNRSSTNHSPANYKTPLLGSHHPTGGDHPPSGNEYSSTPTNNISGSNNRSFPHHDVPGGYDNNPHPLSHATDRNNHLPPAESEYNMMSSRGRGAPTGPYDELSSSSRLSNSDLTYGGRQSPSVVYRHSIDHSYTSRKPPPLIDINSRPPVPLQRSYHRTLMPCVSLDIPIPTLDSHLLNDDAFQLDDNHNSHLLNDDSFHLDDVCDYDDVVITKVEEGGNEELELDSQNDSLLITDTNSDKEIEYILIDADESSMGDKGSSDTEHTDSKDQSDQCLPPHSGSSIATVAINSCSDVVTDQERTVSVASDISDVSFSISPFSIDSFNIDLDTEVESTISSFSSNSQPSEEDNTLLPIVPLNVSFPLSKVSLPTKVLLKPPNTSSSPLHSVASKQNPIEKHPLVNKIQTRSTLKKKQQTEGLQLRNRALPRRNLYLFASRKAPVRTNKDNSCDDNDNSSTIVTTKANEEQQPMVVDTVAGTHESASVEQAPSNLDNSFIIIDETDDSLDTSSGSQETTVYFKKGSPELENHGKPVTSIANVNSPLPPPLSPNNNIKVEDKQLSLTEERNKRKPQKFQDFIPIVLKSRSRAETKTIQRRQKMVIEMQRNEQESRITSPSPDTTERDSHTRRRKRGRVKQYSPVGSSHDDVSSILSDSTTPSSGNQTDRFIPKEFSADVINRSKRIMMNTRDKSGSGDTGLHYICRTGKYDVLCYLLANEENYNVNIQDNAGWTPLHEACSKGHKDIVMLLMEHGANPNLQARDGTRPIHDAIESGHFDIVKYLVDHGADPSVEYSEKTPIELASTNGYPEIADYLTEIYHERRLSNVQKKSELTTNKTIVVKPVKSRASDDEIRLPIEGYQEPLLGPELDKPVFMISAVMEMSSEPMLPVYNLKVSSGPNPRRHNFHIMTDVLKQLQISKEDLLKKLFGIHSYSITVKEFITEVKNNKLTKYAKIIDKLKQVDQSSVIELIPLCSGLHDLLSIVVENIDD